MTFFKLFYLVIIPQSDKNQISHLFPFTDMSRRGRADDMSRRGRATDMFRRGRADDMSRRGRADETLITGHMWVTLCYEYIMIW